MNNEDIIKAYILSAANNALNGNEIKEFPEIMAKVTGAPDNINFSVDGKTMTYAEWLKYLRQRKAKTLVLSEIDSSGNYELNGQTIPDRVLSAFAGVEENSLVAICENYYETYEMQTVFPRRTDISAKEVIDFINSYEGQQRQYFIDAMYFQNEYNTHWTPENDWDKITAAVNENNVEEFVEAFSNSVYNAYSPEGAEEKWKDFYLPRLKDEPWKYLFAATGHAGNYKMKKARPLPELKAGIISALNEIAAYAKHNGFDDWYEYFNSIAEVGAGKKNFEYPEYIKELKLFFNDEAVQIIATFTAQQAFGGMMSWNDLGLEGNAEYDQVSQKLYQALRSALPPVINNGWKK